MNNNNKKINIENKSVDIVQRLHEVIKITGWNKKRLAAEAGVTNQTVSRWFTRKSNPVESNLRKIAENSGMSILYLTSGSGPSRQDELWGYYAQKSTSPDLIDEIYDRIDEVLAATGMNKAQLVAKAEIICKLCMDDHWWLHCDENPLLPADIEKIANATGYSKDWLWYGRGKRLSDAPETLATSAEPTADHENKGDVINSQNPTQSFLDIKKNDRCEIAISHTSTTQPQGGMRTLELSEKEYRIIIGLRKIGKDDYTQGCLEKIEGAAKALSW